MLNLYLDILILQLKKESKKGLIFIDILGILAGSVVPRDDLAVIKMVGREASKWSIKLCGATVSNKEICKLDTHEETHCPCGLHLHVHSFHLCSMLYGLRVKIANHEEYIRNLTDTCG